MVASHARGCELDSLGVFHGLPGSSNQTERRLLHIEAGRAGGARRVRVGQACARSAARMQLKPDRGGFARERVAQVPLLETGRQLRQPGRHSPCRVHGLPPEGLN